MTKVSIIIPVYNVEPYIERCLLSVLNQTYDNIEIILVDDCGQDNSMEVANRVIKNHSNGHKVSILKQEQNNGPSMARNSGINAAIGKYVYFLDSDDEITNDCIETLVRKSDEFEVVIGAIETLPLKGLLKNKKSVFYKENAIKRAYFNGLINDSGCNKLVLREFLLSNNLFFEPGLIHEDYLWTFFLSMACKKIKIIEDVTYFYHRRGGDSLNTNFTIKNVNHLVRCFSIIEDYLINNLKIDTEKYEYLVKCKFLFKIQSIYKVNISFSEFKKLAFSEAKYPFFIWNYKSFCKELIIKLPISLQYMVLKLISKIYEY
jgi:glycosyltransferase involved in cell wall biosynthesis